MCEHSLPSLRGRCPRFVFSPLAWGTQEVSTATPLKTLPPLKEEDEQARFSLLKNPPSWHYVQVIFISLPSVASLNVGFAKFGRPLRIYENSSKKLNLKEIFMVENIATLLVGIACIILGISNMRGNISSLHSYHRHRVSEEDRIPFGKQVGLGTIIVGIGIIIFGVLSSVTLYTENDIFVLVGTAILIVGIILGLVISFRAMIKYNKGVF